MNPRAVGSAVLAVARRRLLHFVRNPAVSVPYFAFPLFFFAFGGGGLSGLGNTPAFDFSSGYTAFYFAFIVLQGSAFTGASAGMSIASDFETGFARRLLLAAPHRTSLIAGYILAPLILALALIAFLFGVALATGMRVDGGVLEIVALASLALLVSVTASLWAAGFALRVRLTQVEPAIAMPIFLSFMLAPAFAPRPLLGSWLRTVAGYNPFTAILEAARGLISGHPDQTALAYLVILGLMTAFTVWTLTGLRQAVRSA